MSIERPRPALPISAPWTMTGLCALALVGCQHAPIHAQDGSEPLDGGLRDHVSFLCELDPPRSAAHPDALDRSAAYIESLFRSAGGRVAEQEYEVDGGHTYRNVIASFGPETGSRMIVGAHYDVCGDYPGADDNGSGVAVLLELAKVLGRTPPDGTVELVAFTLEEPPYFDSRDMGSARHAQDLRDRGVEVTGMISLEMLGFYSDAEGSQTFPAPSLEERYGTVGDFLAVVGRPQDEALVRSTRTAVHREGLRAESLLAPPSVTGVDFSDHRNYWDQGMTAIMITDTAFFRNPNYHEAGDTPDTLDFDRLQLAVHGVHDAITAWQSSTEPSSR